MFKGNDEAHLKGKAKHVNSISCFRFKFVSARIFTRRLVTNASQMSSSPQRRALWQEPEPRQEGRGSGYPMTIS